MSAVTSIPFTAVGGVMPDLIDEMPLPYEVLFGGEGDVIAVPDADRPAWNREDDGYDYPGGTA